MKRAVALMLDGLRRDLVGSNLMPFLHELKNHTQIFESHRSVFPSATRVVSASFSTGCYPAQHELQGNTMLLVEEGGPVVHDAGHPDFLQRKRALTGRSLARPTLAERLSKIGGGAVVFNNVSPGAAFAHDPDGYGRVFHRFLSLDRGRRPVPKDECLDITPDLAGDRVMAQRFIHDLAREPKPAFALMWSGEPDTYQHQVPLGSSEHLKLLSGVDALAREIWNAVERERARGDDILFILGSDHGHQTVTEVIDVQGQLLDALGLPVDSTDVTAVGNGTACLIYLHGPGAQREAEVARFLFRQPWAGQVLGPDRLHEVGQSGSNGLAFAVSMKSSNEPNAFGVPGLSAAVRPAFGKPDRLGCGQHGGLGSFEQSPLLMISGTGFTPATIRGEETSIVDIAPTILVHLGLEPSMMDGRALQMGFGAAAGSAASERAMPD